MRRLSGDDGAVAVVYAVCSVLFFGFGALVVDVGTWYAEGRQLQNGAVAAAVSVAQECARDSACGPSTGSTAESYAELNANDGSTRIADVCGTAPGLPACGAPSGRPNYDCQPLPSSGPLTTAPYVQVHTETLTAGGETRMPPLLIRGFDQLRGGGVSGGTGKTVSACARASYGAPASLTSALPLTISTCEVDIHVGSPPALAPAPPAPLSDLSYEKVLYFHDTTEATPSSCPGSGSGMDSPLSGGFGWLDSTSCVATTDVNGHYPVDPGSSAPGDCSVSALRSMVGKVVDIPIFGGTNGLTGSKGAYVIDGYASFVITGFYLGGSYREPSYLSSTGPKDLPCGDAPTTGSQRCISGYFVEDPKPATGPISGPSTGVTVIQLTG